MGYDLAHEAQERLRSAQEEHFKTNQEIQNNVAREQRERDAVANEYEKRINPVRLKRDEIQRLQADLHKQIETLIEKQRMLQDKVTSLQTSQTKVLSEIQGLERDQGQALVRVRSVYSNKNELLKLKERRLRGNLVTLEQEVKRQQQKQTDMLNKSINKTSSQYSTNRMGTLQKPANDSYRPGSKAA
jgi:chromosome segregation ATPase